MSTTKPKNNMSKNQNLPPSNPVQWTFSSRSAAKAAAYHDLGKPHHLRGEFGNGSPSVFFFSDGNRYLWMLSQGRGYFCADGVIRTDIEPLLAIVCS